jgi:hypothetical protein
VLGTQGNAALVAGASPGGVPAAVRCRVLRAFCLRGVRQEVGSELDLPRHIAMELRALGKVEFAPEAPPSAPEPTPVRSIDPAPESIGNPPRSRRTR